MGVRFLNKRGTFSAKIRSPLPKSGAHYQNGIEKGKVLNLGAEPPHNKLCEVTPLPLGVAG